MHAPGADLTQLQAGNILLIKPSSLGDVVQALPVLSALRRRFPRAKLTWLIGTPCRDLITGHPDLDDVIVFDRPKYRGREKTLWAGGQFLAFLRTLRVRRFDLVVDLQGLLRTGLMALATGARTRIGLSGAREAAGWFYTHRVHEPTPEMGAVDRYWLVAEALGVGHLAKQFIIGWTAEDRAWAQEQVAGLRRPILVVNPGARWPTKCWPAAKFGQVADRFLADTGGSVLLIGGASERSVAEAVAAAMTSGAAVNLAGRTTLKQLAALLAEADLVLTGDSGPMHLAAAVGTPVAAIFTCTRPARARPYGQGHAIVAARTACAGSYRRRCDRLECMADVTEERVWEACRACLEAGKRGR